MSVPVGKRKHGTFEVIVATLDLCVYTLHITANPDKFPVNQITFTEKIRELAIDIHLLCWQANRIRVDDDWQRYDERMKLQKKAVKCFDRLCPLVEIAESLFHISSKRMTFWMEKIMTAKSLIVAWHDSDRKRLLPKPENRIKAV